MTDTPRLDLLTEFCLFCNPSKHGQGRQVLLHSDNFYVFAGIGAIHEGYLIIAPYTCDGTAYDSRCLAQLPRADLDELRFLREVVSAYYKDRYDTPGLSFEHGRAGGCLISADDTRHCYHPHLCCYPVNVSLWDHMDGTAPVEVAGLHGLAAMVGSAPYLYVEHCHVNRDLPVGRAAREEWRARVVPLTEEDQLQSQYLRRVLASAVGRAELWDWVSHPTLDAVDHVVADFPRWLESVDGLAFLPAEGAPRLDFVRSVAHRNALGYDAVCKNYESVWRGYVQHDAVARFVSRLPDRTEGPPRVLDLACGTGIYTKAFHHLGLRCVGTDLSRGMLEAARRGLDQEMQEPHPPQLLRMENSAAAFAPGSFDGIWFSAGLVHTPRAIMARQLGALRELLTDDGVLYISAQIGEGLTTRHEGRVFVYVSESEMDELLRTCGLSVVDRWDGATERGSAGDTRRKVWRHYLATRSSMATLEPPVPQPPQSSLAALGERGLIAHIVSRLRDAGDLLLLSAGDDAAAVTVPAGSVLVATMDPCPQPVISLFEGPDPWVDGWYSMIINISDLGAMGATPIGALLALEARPHHSLADLDRFYDGAIEAADLFGCPVIGGNVKDADRFNCVGVGLGHVRPERMLRRDQARKGEVVLVIGTMGVFWTAVLQAMKGFRVQRADRERLRDALRRPIPRVREGVVLADHGLSRCAMDSSDGVTACLYEIASHSQVDIHIELDGLPVDPVVASVASVAGIDVRKLMLSWGDWQLVCTTAPGRVDAVRSAMASLNCPVWEIGWTSQGTGRVWLHGPEETALLNYVASERFSPRSYFTHGIEAYATILREQPLTLPEPR